MEKHTFIFSYTDNGGGHQGDRQAGGYPQRYEDCEEVRLRRYLRRLGV